MIPKSPPVNNVIILLGFSMQITLNRVALVVEDEDDGVELEAEHRCELLYSKLTESVVSQCMSSWGLYSQTTITDEENCSAKLSIPSCQCGSEGTADGPTNTTPENLADKHSTLGELRDRQPLLRAPKSNHSPECQPGRSWMYPSHRQ
jgi:hypothetical protein